MMQKNYLISLESISRKFSKEKDIFDIVLYGSTTKGKEEGRDIDIILIFKELNLNKRLEIAQIFKKEVKTIIDNSDVKTINLMEFLDKNFLSRQNILIEGISLIDGNALSSKLGFNGFSIFSYNLKNLNNNEKTKFTYALIGRNSEGMIKKLGAEHIGSGAIIIPINKKLIFQEFLESWKINYKIKNVLISQI